MGKTIFYDKRAIAELQDFTENIRNDFNALVRILQQDGRLSPPDAKKITAELFEIRVMHNGAYRGLYAYMRKDSIIILHFFQKKTQKTPIKNIKTAVQRLRNYI